MMAANTTRPSEGGLFARELTRAVAQRGRLDAVYQTLSDHWTLILQRLFPVWSLLGPGLADPGHIELTSRTVYLDSDELLGSREQILAGTLEPRRILATFGVAIHEVLHAKHSKPWIAERDIDAERERGPGRAAARGRPPAASRSRAWKPPACASSPRPAGAERSSATPSAPRWST